MARKKEYILEIDQFIGGKVFSLRLAKGLSCQQLSKLIGVTLQQLRKYEKGINRISAGRLVLMAKALAKDVSYFYEGLETDSDRPVATQHQRMCIEVSRNFMKIISADHQNAVNTLVKSLSRIA